MAMLHEVTKAHLDTPESWALNSVLSCEVSATEQADGIKLDMNLSLEVVHI